MGLERKTNLFVVTAKTGNLILNSRIIKFFFSKHKKKIHDLQEILYTGNFVWHDNSDAGLKKEFT